MSIMNSKIERICGWGVNDVEYNVTRSEIINGKRKEVWICPYYRKWACMIYRCFDPKTQARQPTYKGCSVSEEWKYLSNFIKWVDSQPNKNWKDCDLDKDFLSSGNKCYSSDTVVFITKKVNGFITDCARARGELMIGVCLLFGGKKNPYQANCKNPFTGRKEYLGVFPTEMEAHLAWKTRKHELACQLADAQSDSRIATRLREMYA